MIILPQPWTEQPQIAVGINRGNPLTRSLVSYYALSGGDSWSDLVGTYTATATAGVLPDTPSSISGQSLLARSFNGTAYFDLGTAPLFKGSAISYGIWIRPSSLIPAYTAVVSYITTASRYNQLFIKSTGKLAWYLNDGVNPSISYDGTGSQTVNTNEWTHIALTFLQGGRAKSYVNGVLDNDMSSGSVAFSPNAGPWQIGNDSQTAGRVFVGLMANAPFWNSELSDAEVRSLYERPWQLFAPLERRIFVDVPSGVPSYIGGGSDTLRALTENSTGRTGALGSARDTLRAFNAAATGLAGALGNARDTLKALTESGGGDVASNIVQGGGADTLKPLTAQSTGRTGTVGNARDTFKALLEQAQGRTGMVGFSVDSLKALQASAYAESGAQPIAPPERVGGAPVWWPSKAGGRPWWYRDLKDKADELERMRQLRIDMGILPKAEAKRIAKVVKEVDAFIEEVPTETTADDYIARAEMLAEKVEKLVDQIYEDDDEQTIMQMSRFFFHRRSETFHARTLQ